MFTCIGVCEMATAQASLKFETVLHRHAFFVAEVAITEIFTNVDFSRF